MGVANALRSQWQPAADYFRAAIRCDSECAQAWSYLGLVLWEHFDSPEAKAEALAAAQKALSIQENLSGPHYVLARVAQSQGDLSTAIAQFNRALAIDDKNFPAHYHLGESLLQTGHAGEAAGEFQKVLDHNPKDSGALTDLGYANLSVGRTRQAAGYFQRALQIDPGLAPAKEGLKKASAFP
jgi:tetratricopeptide (TPR) repeat protein